MRIRELNINGFGVFAGLKVQGLAPGLNVFLGDNEAGKSTLLEFVRNVLFGYPTGKESRKYLKHPTPAGAKPGGSLCLQLENARIWELFWQPKTGPGLHSLFEQTDNGLQELDLSEYQQISAEMTRQLYASVYGFSLDELQKLSSLEDDARVSDLLYGAGFGLGSISLPEIIKKLSEKYKDEIWLPRGQRTLNNLLAQIKEVQQKIQAKQEHLPRFSQIKTELEQIREKLADTQAGLGLARTKLAITDDLIRLKNQLPELTAVYGQLDALAQLTVTQEAEQFFAEHSLERITGWNKNRAALQEKLNEIGEEQAKLALTLAHDPETTAALAAEAEIKELQAEKGRYRADQEELANIGSGLQTLTSNPVFSTLFEWESGPETGPDPTHLPTRLNQIQQQAKKLLALATEWQILIQSLEADPARQTKQATPSGFLSPANPAMLLLGLASSTALAYGLYTQMTGSPYTWAVWAGLGAVWAALGGLFIKCRNIRAKKGQELKLREAEDQKITTLAENARPLISALKPLLARVIGLAEKPEDHEADDHSYLLSALQALTPAKGMELESILLDWRGRLSGLELKIKLAESLQQLDQKSAALLLKIFPASDFKPGSFPGNLERLTQALERAHNAQLGESEAKGRMKALAAQQQETLAALQQAKTQLELAFQACGANSMEELQTLYSNWDKRQKLTAEARNLSQRLLAQAAEIIKRMPLAQNFIIPDYNHGQNQSQEPMQPEELLNWLGKENPASLQARRNQLEAERLAFEEEEKQLASRQGERNQEAKSLMAEDELETLALEKEMLLEKARTLARQWSVAALALHHLGEAKRAFEAKHQTGVMKEASAFFKQITGGAFLGLDPSAPENSFAVLTANGESRLPGALSRGTREQLYLALRLALIKNRAASAEPFPLLMDDVLVNFDPSRLRRAVDAILALASTHQILYFTCQPHLAPELLDRARANGVEGQLFKLKNGIVSPA